MKIRLTRGVEALLAAAALALLFASPALADEIIDGGATETVRGDGTGTQPSPWAITGNLAVGVTGSGTLNVEGGGDVILSGNGGIGIDAGSTGGVTVDGSGSSWDMGLGDLFVGASGVGSLGVVNGGRVGVGGIAFIGQHASSAGSYITLTTGALMTVGDKLYVGGDGDSTLTLESGAVLDVASDAYLAYAGGTQGRATVTGAGSGWGVSGNLTIGMAGDGVLSITSGGQVGVGNTGIIADSAGSTGSVFVSGAGWHMDGDLEIGRDGDGSLSIGNHGHVGVDGASAIGVNADGTGEVTVDGAGSNWNLAGALAIGNVGTGRLWITGGGTVSDAQAYLGYQGGAEGVAVVSGGATWTNSGSVSVGRKGRGGLVVSDGGVVTSAGAFIGQLTGGEGVVDVLGTGSLWDTSASILVGSLGSGTLAVADGGTVRSTGTVYLATDAGSQGTLDIGAAATADPVAPGTLDVAQVSFGDGDGAIVFNHTASDYLFSPAISGNGRIDVLAGKTTLGDASAFSGTTTVSGGTLIVNDRLGGTLDILAGGRLQGSGTAGTTTVAGTVAPGNSIGTLSVAGDVTFAAGSAYEVEVDDTGASDRIEATGAAAIDSGSTVTVLPENGTDDGSSYAPETRYTILSAAGGVTGAFGSVSDSFPFLDPELTYDADSVYLTLMRNDTSFAGLGGTRNERATAGGLDALGSGDALHAAIVPLTEPEALAAFDALSGEIHASAKSALIEDSRFVRNAVNDRLRAAFDGPGAAVMPVMAYGEGGPRYVPATTKGFAAWGQAFGSWGHWDGDGNAARLDRSTGGFFVGADAPAFDSWRFGAVAGYSHTAFDVKDRHSSGTSDNYHVGLYGGTAWGDLAFRTGAAYTWHDIWTSRSVDFPGFGDSLKGDYNAATAQVFGELAYGFSAGSARFEPFANLAHVNLHSDGFTEDGGAAALHAGGQATDTSFTTLGIRASMAFNLGGMKTTARGMVGWKHTFGDTTPLATLALTGGDAFSVAGVPIAKDAAVVEAGLDFAVSDNATLGVAYSGQLGSGMSDQSVRASFNITF